MNARPAFPHGRHGLRRKAQTEIVGLALIVILISLSLIFVVRFVVFSDRGTDIVADVDTIQLASNTISSLLDTHVDCKGRKVTVADLYTDCFRYETFDCIDNAPPPSGPGDDPLDPADSCQVVNETVSAMLRPLLDARNYKYQYTARKAGDSEDERTQEIANDDCLGPRHAESYVLPLNPGSVAIRLYVCR